MASVVMSRVFMSFLMVVYSLSTFARATTLVRHNRRILHQPLYPLSTPLTPTLPPDPTPTSISQPPTASPLLQPQPQLQPKYPFSSQLPPTTPSSQNSFFPYYSSPPLASTGLPTFPANIFSLILPQSSSANSSRPISRKLIAVIVAVSLVFAALLTLLAAFLLHHRDHEKTDRHHRTDSLRLVPPNATPSDNDISATKKKSPPLPPPALPRYQTTASSTSSEFLYLGTLVSSREKAAYALKQLILFNKDVFVGQVLTGESIKALVSMGTMCSLEVLSPLIRAIKSPLVNFIDSVGGIPSIISSLNSNDLGVKVTAMDCVLEIGYFGRKEAVEAMLNAGLIKRLVKLQRSELGSDWKKNESGFLEVQ